MSLPKLSVSDRPSRTMARDLPVAPTTVSTWVSEETRRAIVRAFLPLLALIPVATMLLIAVAVTR